MENDLILARLIKIEQKIERLNVFFLGDDNANDIFVPPTQFDILGRQNTGAILKEITELNKRIDALAKTMDNQ